MRADPWHCGTPSPARHSSRAVIQQSPSTMAEEVKTSAGSAPGQARRCGLAAPGGAPAPLCSHAASQTLLPTAHPKHRWGFLLRFTDGLCQEESCPSPRQPVRHKEHQRAAGQSPPEVGGEGTSQLPSTYFLTIPTSLCFHCFSGKRFLKPLLLESFFFI